MLYGTAADGITWKTPVHPGDKIYAESEVNGQKEIKRVGLVTYTWIIKNQNDNVVAQGKNT